MVIMKAYYFWFILFLHAAKGKKSEVFFDISYNLSIEFPDVRIRRVFDILHYCLNYFG